MIDFACKEIDLDDIIKCSFALTKADYRLMMAFAKEADEWHATSELATALGLDLSTIQRGVKRLYEKGILERSQQNLSGGGYTFVYRLKDKKAIRATIQEIVRTWAGRVEQELSRW